MEGSSTSHVRSISLPSRLKPSSTKLETKLNELKSLETSAVAVSTETIQIRLVGLAELYLCLDELICSPHTQQALYRNGVLVEDAFEGSIVLLDSCNEVKELLTSMKENVLLLQSALRRKGGDLTAENQVAAYMCFRKEAKKTIAKSIGSLNRFESKMGSSLLLDVGHHASMVIKVLREVTSITVSLFRSLLLFLSMKAKPINGLSLISKLMSKGTATCDRDQAFINEVETVDLAVSALHKSIRCSETKIVDVQTILRKLQILDVSVEGFEAGLDCLFRKLIQSRTSLLNILAC